MREHPSSSGVPAEPAAAAKAADTSPVWALVLLMVAAQALFTIGLQQPTQPLFDETHYVPAARALIEGSGNLNPEHPPLAKYLIGLGMLLFGDTPFGWRLPSTFMGTATVASIFLIAQSLFGKTRLSVTAGVLTLLNQLVFVQARIAMLDVYMGGFLMLALWCLIDSHGRASPARVQAQLAAAGALFGLAMACKWTPAPYLALALVAIAGLRLREAVGARAGVGGWLFSVRLNGWRGVSTVRAGLYLGGVALLAYLASFAPLLFLDQGGLTLGELLPEQLDIFRLQTQPLGSHPYMSSWWQWPAISRPIWYLYERVDGQLRGVLLIGNPAIMWGGLVAVAACAYAGLRQRDSRLLLVAGIYLFAFGVWIVIPKRIGFYYYYYVPAMFLSLALAAALDRFGAAAGRRWLTPAFVTMSAILFAYFYPILAARPLGGDQAFLGWMWFDSWR